jgi:hypothetical protein
MFSKEGSSACALTTHSYMQVMKNTSQRGLQDCTEGMRNARSRLGAHVHVAHILGRQSFLMQWWPPASPLVPEKLLLQSTLATSPQSPLCVQSCTPRDAPQGYN